MSNVYLMETTINGRNYTGIKCGTFKALTLAGKMAPVIIAAISGKDLTEAFASGDFLENIAKELLTNISCEGSKINGDEHFMHHPEDLIPVVVWSAQAQVLPYFSAEAIQSISQALIPETQEVAE